MPRSVELVLVQVNFPKDLIAKIDSRGRIKGDRSEFIRSACREKIRRQEETERRKQLLEVPT